jgi:hypothetical protein
MEFKSFMEALKGKQHKIDKNKNGKVDAHDFELLRKEETEELEEDHLVDYRRYTQAAKNAKAKGDHDIAKDAEAKANKSAEHYKRITGKTATFNEESEELDEIHRMKTKLNTLDDISNKSVARQKLSNLMKSGKARGALIANKMRTLNMGDDLDQEDLDALYEVLSKDAKAGDYISDFVHSTNPKFDGKSKKERINMALGAYYNTNKKKDGMSEGNGYDDNRRGFGKPPREDDEYHVPDPEMKKIKVKQEELTGNQHKIDKNKNGKIDGHDFKLLRKEETEELDEANHRDFASQGLMHPDMAKHMKTGQEVDFYHSKTGDKISGVVKHTTSGEVHIKAHKDGKMAAGDVHKFKVSSELKEDKMTTQKDKNGKLISFKYEGDWKKTTAASTKKNPAGKVANMAGQAMQKMRNMSEEKDEQEYGYEGDMALNQLATLTRCADMIKEILKPDTDLPEWVQSKITLATDYIQTAADYMHSEMNEAKSVTVKVNAAGDAPHEEKWEAVKKVKKPVAEAVQKADIPAYLRKAKGDTPLKMDDLKRKDTLSDAENLKRNRGVKESFDDEGNLISNKVSYKEFMLEYTPGPGGVTQIKGRSYGASYSDPEGADDYDDKKPMKPAAEKRGRGRPAGAKSGARKITGTSKLMNK